ncbi:MAG: sigma-54 dependent transcriptional regulator [Acidobacteriota bacterium]|nr:sigma-54 dependent transcriptional regulator [Acidobacteriota bacterium]
MPTREVTASHPKHVLLAGDDPDLLSCLASLPDGHGKQITTDNVESTLLRLRKGLKPDAILLHATGENSLKCVATLHEIAPSAELTVMFSFSDPHFTARAIQAGASGCLHLPFELPRLTAMLTSLPPREETPPAKCLETSLFDGRCFVSASPAMNEIRAQASILARVDLPILILGESGTGKEILAEYIHKLSPRAHRSFLKVNCAAIPADLLESELFGYEKGAFTGAAGSKPGKFEMCNKGTILLDEIGEMPSPMQSKLLQVLQDGTFSRLGGRSQVKVDVRIIAATNIDIQSAIRERKFREDLYFRLNGFSVLLPPLRERREEIHFLVEHFLRKNAANFAGAPQAMPARLLEACQQYRWPGNLRELENFVRRFMLLGDDTPLLNELRQKQAAENSQAAASLEATGGLKQRARSAVSEAETEVIAGALRRNNWNRKRAALELQISYKALLYKIRLYELSPESPRQ